jgi:hypothetical protein
MPDAVLSEGLIDSRFTEHDDVAAQVPVKAEAIHAVLIFGRIRPANVRGRLANEARLLGFPAGGLKKS